MHTLRHQLVSAALGIGLAIITLRHPIPIYYQFSCGLNYCYVQIHAGGGFIWSLIRQDRD